MRSTTSGSTSMTPGQVQADPTIDDESSRRRLNEHMFPVDSDGYVWWGGYGCSCGDPGVFCGGAWWWGCCASWLVWQAAASSAAVVVSPG